MAFDSMEDGKMAKLGFSDGGSSRAGGDNGGPADDGSGGSDAKVLHTFHTEFNFVHVQSLLDQNRILISEFNQNHEFRAGA